MKQNVRSTAWFFLVAYSKVGEETETKEIIVNKTELELEDLENAQLVLIAKKKMRKHFSGDRTEGYSLHLSHRAGRPAGSVLPGFQKSEEGANKDCSQALKRGASYFLGPAAPLFFPLLPSGMRVTLLSLS